MEALSNNEIRQIRSLREKKFRDESGLFLVEGEKMVSEALSSGLDVVRGVRRSDVGEKIMERISSQTSPSPVLAVVRKPVPAVHGASGLCLALDSVRDPGNMGTILRLADWFGIGHIFCSMATADAFSPKVVQSTMGSIARVTLHYTDLSELFSQLDGKVPVYGTFLDGSNIYEQPGLANGIIVMGNEGNGISPAIETFVSKRLLIPSYPMGRPTAESLNVAVATAITCAEFRRRQLLSEE